MSSDSVFCVTLHYFKVLSNFFSGPPGEPAGVFQGDNLGLDYQVVAPSDRVVQLYWSDGDSHGSSILAYTVEFRTNFDQRWRTHPQADSECFFRHHVCVCACACNIL